MRTVSALKQTIAHILVTSFRKNVLLLGFAFEAVRKNAYTYSYNILGDYKIICALILFISLMNQFKYMHFATNKPSLHIVYCFVHGYEIICSQP